MLLQEFMRDRRAVTGVRGSEVQLLTDEQGLSQRGLHRLMSRAFRIETLHTADRAQPHTVPGARPEAHARAAEKIAQRLHRDAARLCIILLCRSAPENIQQPARARKHPMHIGGDEPLLAIKQEARETLQDDEVSLHVAGTRHIELRDEHPQRLLLAAHGHRDGERILTERKRSFNDCRGGVCKTFAERREGRREDSPRRDGHARQTGIPAPWKKGESARIQERPEELEQRSQFPRR